MKLVINKEYGGFSLSDKYMKEFKARYYSDIKRDDPRLIKLVESGKPDISLYYSDLQVIEIPDNSFYVIISYDGLETVYYSLSEIIMYQQKA